MEMTQIFDNIINRINNIENKNDKDNKEYFKKEIILIIIQTSILIICLLAEKFIK